MLHLLITEVLNRKKDTIKITVATNRCPENLQFYFDNYWKSDFQFSKFYNINRALGLIYQVPSMQR